MLITAEALYKAQKNEYKIHDLRSAYDRNYGCIENSFPTTEEDAYSFEDRGEKMVFVCKNGEKSKAVADALCARGLKAYALEGGYSSWLRYLMEVPRKEGYKESVEHSLRKKFAKSLMSPFIHAIKTYELISAGDRIAVCISGGKDSMLLAKLFQELQRHSDVPFETEYLVMDPGYTPENRKLIEVNARDLGIPIKIFDSDIFDSVYEIGKSPCYFCARMRRGHLYKFAKSLGCNKIALGHHYDDVIETILMGMLYAGQFQTMMPKLHSENFEGMELIRPLYLVRESDVKAWRDYNDLRFLQCACKFTDNNSSDMEHSSKRQEIKMLIRELKKTNETVEKCIFRSVENVNLNEVIEYKKDGVRHHFLDDYGD